ncbi:hypothetical protein KAI87_08425, partial [Myxococcota bacterium]|nr:hypothetical protein [Myxococcota bacterium]
MRKLAILLSFGAALSVVACDQLTATTQAVAILTRTPDLAEAITDTALRTAVLAELAKLDVEEGVIAAVGMGERETPTSTAQPDPIMGASIDVSWGTDTADLCEITEPGAEGTYGCTNIDAGDEAQGCIAA